MDKIVHMFSCWCTKLGLNLTSIWWSSQFMIHGISSVGLLVTTFPWFLRGRNGFTMPHVIVIRFVCWFLIALHPTISNSSIYMCKLLQVQLNLSFESTSNAFVASKEDCLHVLSTAAWFGSGFGCEYVSNFRYAFQVHVLVYLFSSASHLSLSLFIYLFNSTSHLRQPYPNPKKKQKNKTKKKKHTNLKRKRRERRKHTKRNCTQQKKKTNKKNTEQKIATK